MHLKRLFQKEDPSLRMSFPKEPVLHGVRIRKLPVGKYLQAMRALEEIPASLLKALFPEGASTGEILSTLSSLQGDALGPFLTRLLISLPEELCRLLSSLLDIPEGRLLDPEAKDALSLGELAEIVEALWKENDLSAFFGSARRLMEAAGAPGTQGTPGMPKPGSSGGSPSPRTSAFPNRS